MKKQLILFLTVLLALASGVKAQVITGKVVNADQEPLIGVVVKGGNNKTGVTTDADGIFKLNLGKEPKLLTDLQNLPNTVAPKYRKGEKAELLVKIVRDIDAQMKNDSNWKWALVMRVMLDEGIIMVRIPNKFDELICSMIPGKGRDTVRKNGNYNVLETKRSWRNWIENAGVDRDEAQNRMVCEEIYGFLKPLLEK